MALTKEELMRLRYKFIADYPGSFYDIGHIIETRENQKDWQESFENYPHLYKKLSWWEDRKPEDMPEYVGYKFLPDSDEKIIKVNKHFSDSNYLPNNRLFTDFSPNQAWPNIYSYSKSRPATEAEYHQYINSIKKK